MKFHSTTYEFALPKNAVISIRWTLNTAPKRKYRAIIRCTGEFDMQYETDLIPTKRNSELLIKKFKDYIKTDQYKALKN